MLRFVLRRLSYYSITFLGVFSVVFALKNHTAGDPVVQSSASQVDLQDNKKTAFAAQQQAYHEQRASLHLNGPLFYLRLSSPVYPDTLFLVDNPEQRDWLYAVLHDYGNWPAVSTAYTALRSSQDTLMAWFDKGVHSDSLSDCLHQVQNLWTIHQLPEMMAALDSIHVPKAYPSLPPLITLAQTRTQWVVSHPSRYKHLIPVLHWYGFNNQYHHWLKAVLSFHWGIAYQDKRSVTDKLSEALPWTIAMGSIAFLLVFLIGLPLGIYGASRQGTLTDKAIQNTIFILYAIPAFWVATLMINFLCQPAYLNWFPPRTPGRIAPDMSLWQIIAIRVQHLTLPLICWSYLGAAYLSQQVRTSMIHTLRLDYIRTAYAKGLSKKRVLGYHALLNAFLPVVAILGQLFPQIIVGAYALEIIFDIPGMGKLIFEAVNNHDFPVIFAVLLVTSFFTMLGNLLADVIYRILDVRMKN